MKNKFLKLVCEKPFWVLYGVIGGLLLMNITDAFSSLQSGVPLPVTALGNMATYHRFELSNHSYFVSGADGSMWWYPKNLWDALILTAFTESGMDVLHLLLIVIYIAIFQFKTRQTDSQILVGKQITRGFSYIVSVLTISSSADIFLFAFLKFYVKHITNGQFSMQQAHFPFLYYYLIGAMLLSLNGYVKKAGKIQQEQALTI